MTEVEAIMEVEKAIGSLALTLALGLFAIMIVLIGIMWSKR